MESYEIEEPGESGSPDSTSTSASGLNSEVTSSPPRRAPDIVSVPKMKKKDKKSKVDEQKTGTFKKRSPKHVGKMAALRLQFVKLKCVNAALQAMIAQRDREVAAAEQKLQTQRILILKIVALTADYSLGLQPGLYPLPTEPEDSNGTK